MQFMLTKQQLCQTSVDICIFISENAAGNVIQLIKKKKKRKVHSDLRSFGILYWFRPYFLFVGLRYTDQNFKVRRSEKNKIKTELQPKTYKVIRMSETLFPPMTHTISYMYI